MTDQPLSPRRAGRRHPSLLHSPWFYGVLLLGAACWAAVAWGVWRFS